MKLPKGWHEIKLSQFIDIYDVIQDSSIDDIDKSIRIFSLLSGLSIDDVESMTLSAWSEQQEKIKWVMNLPEAGIPKSFKLGGYLWKPVLDIRQITAGDYITSVELTKNPENIIINIPQLAALYLTPHKGLFKRKADLSYEQRVNILKEASVAQIYPLTLFFCKVLIGLMESIPDYLIDRMNQMTSQADTLNGDGI